VPARSPFLPYPAAGRARRPTMSCGPARAAAPGLAFTRAVARPRPRKRPSSRTHGRLRERGRVIHHHDGEIMVPTGKKQRVLVHGVPVVPPPVGGEQRMVLGDDPARPRFPRGGWGWRAWACVAGGGIHGLAVWFSAISKR
jgi:hypothetical protein